MKQRGFTLIELMVTVAVIAILATIAYASYGAYVKRGYRSEAKSALLQDATILERNFTTANRYDQDSGGNAMNTQIIQYAPTSGTHVYQISVSYNTTPAMDFTLTAQPLSGGPMANDECGSFTLTNAGAQGLSGNTGSTTAADCWGK